jgi:hypothetical protein
MFSGPDYNILLSTAGCRIKRNCIIIVSLGPRVSGFVFFCMPKTMEKGVFFPPGKAIEI